MRRLLLSAAETIGAPCAYLRAASHSSLKIRISSSSSVKLDVSGMRLHGRPQVRQSVLTAHSLEGAGHEVVVHPFVDRLGDLFPSLNLIHHNRRSQTRAVSRAGLLNATFDFRFSITNLRSDVPVAGEVAEWSIVPDSKSGEPARVPGVRIPPSPPVDRYRGPRCCATGIVLTRTASSNGEVSA